MGKKPEANRSTERKVIPVQAGPAGSACLETRRPKSIRGRGGIGGGGGGTSSELTQGGLRGSARAVDLKEANDDGTMSTQKSDLFIVATKLVKASRAKEGMD